MTTATRDMARPRATVRRSPQSAPHEEDSPSSKTPRKSRKKNSDPQADAAAAELAARLNAAIEQSERLAESEIELAKLFLENGRRDTARRRLEQTLELYPHSQAATVARQMLASLRG